MKLQFICTPFLHRIAENEHLTRTCWEKGFDTGLYYFEKMMWDEALPYLGQAYEAALLLFDNPRVDDNQSGEWLTASALSLISTLANLDLHEHIATIHAETTKRLQKLQQTGADGGFWRQKFDEQIAVHSLHPDSLDQFAGMQIVDRKIYPQGATLH